MHAYHWNNVCKKLIAHDSTKALPLLGTLLQQMDNMSYVILDVLMPVVDGRQALAILRQDPGCHHIPVIMLTAITGESLVQQCSHLGISGYLVKPVATDALRDVVARVLGATMQMPLPSGATDAVRPALLG